MVEAGLAARGGSDGVRNDCRDVVLDEVGMAIRRGSAGATGAAGQPKLNETALDNCSFP